MKRFLLGKKTGGTLLSFVVAVLIQNYASAADDDQREVSGQMDNPRIAAGVPSGLESGRTANSTSSQLLTTLYLDNGNYVEFWEVSDNNILVAEGGKYPSTPSIDQTVVQQRNVLELYHHLAPQGTPAPEQLVKAAQREAILRSQTQLKQDAPGEKVAPPSTSSMAEQLSSAANPQASVDTSKCPWSWFDDQFSLVTQGPADPDNWSWPQRTGTTSYLNGRMSIVLASACSYRGNVRFNFWTKPTNTILWGNDPTFTRVVHAGEWYWVMSRAEWWYQYARDIYSEVTYATGDGYHHKGIGCDRKAFSQCAVNAPNGQGYWGE